MHPTGFIQLAHGSIDDGNAGLACLQRSNASVSLRQGSPNVLSLKGLSMLTLGTSIIKFR